MKPTNGNNNFCEQRYAIGVSWERTSAGTSAVRSCPRDAVGKYSVLLILCCLLALNSLSEFIVP